MATSRSLVRARIIGTRHIEGRMADLRLELGRFNNLLQTDKKGNPKFVLRKEVGEKVRRLSEPIEVTEAVCEIQPFRPVMVKLASADHVGFLEFEGQFMGILKYFASAYSLAGFAVSSLGALKSMTEVFVVGIMSGIAGGAFALACYFQQKRHKKEEGIAKQQFLEALRDAVPFLRNDSN